MTDPWLTYTQAAEKLGVSRQAVRQKATRGRWPRTRGNDGQARIQVPEQPYRPRTVTVPVPDDPLVGSLREHISTLKADIDRLTGDNERLHSDLTAERAAHQEQLEAAMSQLVELARRMAAIAETQTSTEAAEAEPEPPHHWAIRAWRWMQKTA